MDRLTLEQHFHDQQAHDRATDLRCGREWPIDDDAYLDHETWIRPAFDMLGNIAGQHVLDFGCGHGMAAVVLARRGARVTAFDLSCGYLHEARRRAERNRVIVDFVQVDGERLPFADATFAAIWGNAVLHHLDLSVAGAELRRVLQPGGVAVFCEPWGGNPLLGWARRFVPYPGKQRTSDEEPLRQCDVDVLRQIFPRVDVTGFQLLSMIRRVARWPWLDSRLQRFDAGLLKSLPSLQRWCRYVVITLRRC